MSAEPATGEDLERELEALLGQERFPPRAGFAEGALIGDMRLHEQAARDPLAWWESCAAQLDWLAQPTRTLNDDRPPFYRWFEGGKINASYNCLDRHVSAGLGDRVAFHWHGEDGRQRTITYAWLLEQTQRAANALLDRGVGAGDVVGIYLPMIPEVLVAMLACARIGAPHNVVFGGFAPEAVRERMQSSDAKALITVDGIRRRGQIVPVKASVDAVGMPVQSTLVVRHAGVADCPMGDGDAWWHDALDAAAATCEPAALDSEHPLYVLYSSGSTAKPKGILHTTGGYLTQVAFTHRYVFDLRPETDVYWCSADVGWVTGHSYIVYGPLLNGATSVMYEGAPDHPHRGIWWELCERYGVTIFYTAPTAVRMCMKWGADVVSGYDLSKLRLLGSVGEPINPKAWLWYWKVIGGGRCPIVDTWWQTETGAIMVTTLPGAQGAKPGSAGTPLPGIDAAVLDDEGNEVADGAQGLLAIRAPWPGMLRTLLGDDERYVETYWSKWPQGHYLVGDAARRDEDGYLWVVGRVDDVLNVSGHRMSTAEIESAIVSHPKVAECAVIGAADPETGQAVVAFVTLEAGATGSQELVADVREHVAARIGKLARPRRIVWAEDLPKTRSGKIMRRLLRDVAEGRALGDSTTLRNADVLLQLRDAVAEGQAG